MATKRAGGVLVELDATDAKLRNAMRRAGREFGQQEKQMMRLRKRAQALNATYDKFTGTLKGVAAAYVSIQGLRLFVDTLGEVQVLENQLKLVTKSSSELDATWEQLSDTAKSTRGPLNETIQLYAKMRQFVDASTASNKDLMQVVEGVNLAVAIAGVDTQTAAASVMQFTQAMSSGVFQGDELRSVMEGIPPLAKALAGELGISVGELRKWGAEGKLTSDVVIPAVGRALDSLRADFKSTDLTIGQAQTGLSTAMTNLARSFDETTGVGNLVVAVIQKITKEVDNLNDVLKEEGGPIDMFDVDQGWWQRMLAYARQAIHSGGHKATGDETAYLHPEMLLLRQAEIASQAKKEAEAEYARIAELLGARAGMDTNPLARSITEGLEKDLERKAAELDRATERLKHALFMLESYRSIEMGSVDEAEPPARGMSEEERRKQLQWRWEARDDLLALMAEEEKLERRRLQWRWEARDDLLALMQAEEQQREDQLQKQKEYYDRIAKLEEERKQVLSAAAKAAQMAWEEAAEGISGAMSKAFGDVLSGARSLEDGIRSIVSSIIAELSRIYVTDHLATFIADGLKQLPSIFSRAFSGPGYSSPGNPHIGGSIAPRPAPAAPRTASSRTYRPDAFERPAAGAAPAGGAARAVTVRIETLVGSIQSTDGPGVQAALAQAAPVMMEAIREEVITSLGRPGVARLATLGR